MVVVLGKVQFEQGALRPPFLYGIHCIQAIGRLFQAIVRVIVRIRRGHSARLRIPGVDIRRAERPARHIPVFHVIHRAKEDRFFAVGVKVGAVIPPDIETTIGRGVGRGHTLQEVALLAISLHPGSLETQIQDIRHLITKG